MSFNKLRKKALTIVLQYSSTQSLLEIISETGILGLFIIIFLLMKLIIRYMSLFVHDKENRRELLLTFLPVLMLLNPIQFTGSFFSTYSGFLFLILGVAFKQISNYSNIK